MRRYAPVCRAAVSPTNKNTATEDVWLWRSLALRVAGFDSPDFERLYEMVSLSHLDEYATNEGRIVSTSGLSIDVTEYERTFEERRSRTARPCIRSANTMRSATTSARWLA